VRNGDRNAPQCLGSKPNNRTTAPDTTTPSPGRFLNEDPLQGGGGGPNFYSYVHNNSTNLVDPFGLNPAWPCIGPIIRPWGPISIPWGKVLGATGRAVAIPIIIVLELTLGAEATNSRDDVVPKPCDKNKQDCDKEWADAYADCQKLLALPHPPRSMTGGYTDLHDCARGLVSEACGGNPLTGKKK
jgi:hypothetical protein